MTIPIRKIYRQVVSGGEEDIILITKRSFMTHAVPEPPKVSKRKLGNIAGDEEKTAMAAHLTYVTDRDPGLERRKKGERFVYYYKNKRITDDEVLVRIKSLVIPPAWERVWICKKENGHLQATGYDQLNRKQYKYHPKWNSLRNETKFYRLRDFGRSLPEIRMQLERDLQIPQLNERKVLAAAVSLMELTHIRIGNSFYEKAYGSFGLTTLKDRHVTYSGQGVTFTFRGKKGVDQKISLKSKKLAAIIKKCRDIPGKELFQFYDEDQNRHPIDSGMVNHYIREISHSDFTAKDFRTWAGTVQAFLALTEAGSCQTEAEMKRKIADALDTVSMHLGNTRAVCKKYYVHPLILSLYENKLLEKYTMASGKDSADHAKSLLLPEEQAVMKILESH
jgi:DNA topoisomerase-1